MKVWDLKPDQKVTINGVVAEYLGAQIMKFPNFGKVEKRVFKGFKAYSLNTIALISKK